MGKGNKAEMLIAICAVISSIAAVYIAWDQARVMRSQEKADVWPILQLQHNTSADETGALYEFDVHNAGVGPALVEDYIIRMPGQADTKSFEDTIRLFMGDALKEQFGDPAFSNQSLVGRVIRQGDRVRKVGAFWRHQEGLNEAFFAVVDTLVSGQRPVAEVFVCYCSIHEDCWVSSTLEGTLRPVEVKSCKQLPKTIDQLFPRTPVSPQTEESAS